MDDGKKRQLTCCSLSSFQSLAALRQSIVVIQSRHHQASFSVIVKCLQWIHFQIKRMKKKRELSSSTHNERNSLGNTRDRTERDWTFRTVCWHIRLTKITVQRKRKFIYMKRTNEMVRLSCKRRYAYFVAINTKHDWNNTHEHGARAVDTNEKYSSALKWAQAKKFADCRGNWNWLLNENEMKKKARTQRMHSSGTKWTSEWMKWVAQKKNLWKRKKRSRASYTHSHTVADCKRAILQYIRMPHTHFYYHGHHRSGRTTVADTKNAQRISFIYAIGHRRAFSAQRTFYPHTQHMRPCSFAKWASSRTFYFLSYPS